MNRNSKKSVNQGTPVKKKKKSVLAIINSALTVLTHIAIGLLVYFSYQYYGLSKITFVCALGIIVCVLIISNLLLYVGNNFHDRRVRIANCVIISILFIGSTYGALTMFRLTSSVNKIVENSGKEQYENISVVFVSYGKEYKELKDLNGLTVGTLYETNVGTSSLAKEKIESQNVICDLVDCSSVNDLFYGLIEGTLDVAVMPGSYRQLFENTDYDYSEYLEKMYDFYSFEEKVLVDENENANKDLTAEPFNVLLIGFAQNNAQSSYGLADTIIVATVNPQTMTVALTSIPRDSFVPISCYGGTKDKINAARGTSRACLMETVSDLIDMDIDFYMEVNFEAIVDIVDALGGIIIDSPVEFVGQNSSYTRGEMTVLVTAGEHPAMGEEVLAFARERHAMPNGDFDRQQHQQEVIREIARGIINLRDVNKALKIMEACGDNISTNMSISQLTGVMNYILNANNYLDIDQFDIIDIQNLRMSGYSSWHYNEQLELPVWIYKLYNGSVDETTERINNTLGNYSTVNQINRYYFFAKYPYERGRLYSTSFDETEVHEDLPLYCPYLTTMSYSEADAWAQKNGLKLSVQFITTGYPESSAGMVVDQGTKYGKKLNAGDTVSITVFGIDESKCVPNFVGKSYLTAVDWAKEKGYTITLEEVKDGVTGTGGTVISQTPTAGSLTDKYNTLVLKYYAFATVDASTLVGKSESEVTSWVKEKMLYPDSVTYKNIITDDTTKVGKVASAAFTSGTVSKSNDKTLVITMYVKAQNYDLTFAVDPSASGTVSVNGTASTGGSYSNAAKITLTATSASAGYKFAGWYIGSDLISSNNPLDYLPSKAATITAKFAEKKQFKVTVASGGNGTVNISEGTDTVYEGGSLTINAVPDEGYIFASWSDGGAQSHAVSPTADTTYTATFAPKPVTYSASASVASGCESMGFVFVDSSTVNQGSSVTFTAGASAGYHFVSWSDGSTDATHVVTPTADISLTATFAAD